MGEPNKGHADPEKGQLHQDVDAHPSHGITKVVSKAGEGLKTGILSAGSIVKDAGKKVGEGMVALVPHVDDGAGKKSKQKKNPGRAKAEKKFHKHFQPVPREEPKDTNIVGNITKLLPANTFLMFQTLAPLATNDGNCHQSEIIMTSLMLIVLASTCMLVCFTDTMQFNGKVYHGLVTSSGLWNPSFKGDPVFIDLRTYELKLAQFYQDRRKYKEGKRKAEQEGSPPPPRPEEPMKPNGPHIMGSTYSSGNTQYQLKFTDFLHAVLSAMAFATLTMLTTPVSTCFYPDIPSTVVKTLPLLVGFVISAIFAFSPPARNGVAHPLPPKVPSVTDHYRPPDPKGVVHGPSLPPKPPVKGDNKKPDDDGDDEDSLTGPAKRNPGRLFSSSNRDDHSPNHRSALEGVKSFTNGLFNKHENEIREGAAKVAQTLGDEVKKEASHLLGRWGSKSTLDKEGTFAATLASAAARETGSLLQVGADQGMAGVRDELARKQASITQPVSSLAQGVASVALQGAQAASEVHADVMKQKAALVEEVNAQIQALSTPPTSVAQDFAALRKGAPGSLTEQARDEASQKLIDGVNSQFAATLAHSRARGMSMRMHAMPPVHEHISQQLQPTASVAIDVASLLQQGSQMHTQLAGQQAALSQGLINPTQAAAQQVVEAHLRHLASLQLQPPEVTAALLTAAQPAASVVIDTIVDSRPMQQMRDNAGLVIEDATDAAAPGQALVAAAPSVSQLVTRTADAARQGLAAASARLWRDQRAESTEITDSNSIEEITSESETEGRSRDRFRADEPGSSSKSVKKL